MRTPEPHEGVLGRAVSLVYWALALEGLLLLTTAPGLVLIALLTPDASNAPLLAIALVPVAPALSAAVFAWRARGREHDLAPAQHFWRGYRLNALDVSRWWLPALAVGTALAVNLAHLRAVPGGWLLGPLLGLLTLASGLVAGHLLVITSLYAFRTRDALRLAGWFLVRRPLSTLGLASYAVLAAGVVVVGSDWVLALLGSVLAAALLRNAAPILRDVEATFTVPIGSVPTGSVPGGSVPTGSVPGGSADGAAAGVGDA
ncbi:DUF624 domain-containing protein [Cellulomonas cellasea]|uniref:DUF624 domain-containing protein n=1 Tax=Cellulomonas cellasea TaxID=43670 RepID=UPI0025A4A89B|nr:DUF624 domain-containing protein [Cellulomonas cellasea]MDM8086035.1 DUF624 domain-containing protein [Cellulomonas cellasea]